MRTILLSLILAALSMILNAQTWKVRVEKTTGSHRVKTLRIKPTMQLTVGNQLPVTDTLKQYKYYYGEFISGSADSLQMKLKTITAHQLYTNGIHYTSVVPAKQYYLSTPSADTNMMRIALSDIHSLDYSFEKWRGMSEIGEPVILGSLLVLIFSPLICYNFSDGKINPESYRNWALGSTIGIVAGIGTAVAISAIFPHGRYQFLEGWPYKKAKVWKFR
ncbi:MAG TPA: hypothetical protein PLJ84_10920 [Bacteroidales bacterium]|nr:hypothetical protein [Bacteroidales bacterium]HPT03098.1 hypothetical protein [Bacteroidales bacterium]